MSTKPTRTTGERVATGALVALAAIDTLLLLAIAWLTTFEASLPREPGDLDTRMWSPWSATLVAAFSATLVLSWVALLFVTRRSAVSLAMVTALSLAFVAVILGLATYLSCAEGWRQWAGIAGWVLYTFTGSVESDSSAGAVCAANFAPGSQLARTAALLAVFSGALGAFMLLWRRPFDRLAAALASDVDVVVGLNAQSLPLIEALAEEGTRRRRREQWLANDFGNWTRQDVGELLRLRTKVIVFESGATREQLERVRQWGAIVLPDDPADPHVMRSILGRRKWYPPWYRHTAVRRFYAVDSNVQVNAGAYTTAVDLLLDPNLRERPDTVVPRLSIRLDSARDAREWRIQEIGSRLAQSPRVGKAGATASRVGEAPSEGTADIVAYYSDALAAERVMAADIVEQALSPDADHLPGDGPAQVWVFGEGTLGLAVAEEFAWQLWARYEVRAQGVLRAIPQVEVARQELHDVLDPPDAKIAGGKVAKAAGDLGIAWAALHKAKQELEECHWRPALRWVVFSGPGAQARAREWDETHSPYQLPEWALVVDQQVREFPELAEALPFPRLTAFDVLAASNESATEAEGQLRDLALKEPGRHMFVFATGTTAEEAVARRLAYLRGPDGTAAARVFLFDANVEGLAVRPGTHTAATGAPEGLSHEAGSGGIHRFGPSLVRRVGGVPKIASDIATRLARQQHRCFRGEWGPPADSPPREVTWRTDTKPINAADAPWRGLGPFFQEENIRQVWSVLQFFAIDGWRWDRVGARQSPGEFGSNPADLTEVLNDLAEAEHTRWKELREQQGWWLPRPGNGRDTRYRRHTMLVDWDSLTPDDQDYNRRLILMILARLYAIGVVPVRVSIPDDAAAGLPADTAAAGDEDGQQQASTPAASPPPPE